MSQTKINPLDDVVFFQSVKGNKAKNYVVLVKSQKHLVFNHVVLEKLNINDWENILVGYSLKADTIVLKKSSPEEYGACLFKKEKERKNKTGKVINRRSIHIGHLLSAYPGLGGSRAWEVAKENNIMYLTRIKS
jgi:hypothetical protein